MYCCLLPTVCSKKSRPAPFPRKAADLRRECQLSRVYYSRGGLTINR